MLYSIPTEKLNEVTEKLEKIGKKCEKYGCDFRFNILSESVKFECWWQDLSGNWDKDILDDEPAHGKYDIVEPVPYTEIDLEGIAILNGWKVVASLERTQTGNIIRAICGEEIPVLYRTREAICDHCQTSRNRKETFIVKNLETGEFRQVGKSCLKDYTGIDAEGVIAALNAVKYVKEFNPDDEFVRIPTGRWVNPKTFVAFAIECVRCFGFVKKTPGEWENSTAGRAHNLYKASCGISVPSDVEKLYKSLRERGFNPDSKSVKEQAEKAIAWAREIDSNTCNEYLHNLKAVCGKSVVTYSDFGLLASLPSAYDRATARNAEQAKQAESSSWIGQVGDKVTLRIASAKCVTSYETMYGTTFIFQFVDNGGNTVIWKTSKEINTDQVKELRGTVKAHTEYKDIKQTELTRCKVTA